MKAQRNGHSVPGGSKGRKLKLLLVGRDYERNNNAARRIFSRDRSWITGRSATLLGALQRLQSGAIDLVLLSHEFQEEELALFIADARRNGFAGLILRPAAAQVSGLDSSGDLHTADFSTQRQLEETLYSARPDLRMDGGMGRQNKRSACPISLTAKQRAVLACVSRGWTSQQVARHLKCSEGAIKATLQQLFRKLGVRKRAQIVRLAFEKALIHIGKEPGPAPAGRGPLDHAVELPTEMRGKEQIHVGDFVVNVPMHRVWIRGVETHLTPTEFELLTIFAMHPGELVRSTTLFEMFWRDSTVKQDALRVLICGLRAKIGESGTPRYIVTERNFGYRFIPSPQ